jgi:hypothetical protein
MTRHIAIEGDTIDRLGHDAAVAAHDGGVRIFTGPAGLLRQRDAMHHHAPIHGLLLRARHWSA